jgi:hypothetical protein
MEWTLDEELTIAGIVASETMHGPQKTKGDRRTPCTRIEAIRRLQRRTRAGAYCAPVGVVLANATLPVTPEAELTAEQQAVLAAGRASKR